MSSKTTIKPPTYKPPTPVKWEDCLWQPDKEEVYTIAELAAKRAFPFSIVKAKATAGISYKAWKVGTILSITGEIEGRWCTSTINPAQGRNWWVSDTKSWRFA